MSRIRSIHPGLFTDEAYMSMSAYAKAAWPALWTECDDHGAFEWKPIVLKARLFPADNIDFTEILDELKRLGSVVEYAAAGKKYGVVRNFGKFQRPKKPSYIHPVPDECLRIAGFASVSSEPVRNQFGTGSGKSPQMEDEGGKRDDDDDAGASEVAAEPAKQPSAISEVSLGLTEQVLAAAGVDEMHPLAYGAPMQVQAWLNEGCHPEVILAACKRALANKRDGPPTSFRYFSRAVAQERARMAEPLPVVTIEPQKPGIVNVRDSRNVETSLVAAGRRRIEELQRIRDGLGSGTGGENSVGLSDGHPHVRLLPAAGRG